MRERRGRGDEPSKVGNAVDGMGAVGKRTLVEQVPAGTSIQHHTDTMPVLQLGRPESGTSSDPGAPPVQLDIGTPALVDTEVQDVARAGVADSGMPLPHLDAIQRSFGPHDVGGIRAHIGGAAAAAAGSIGATAYATGNDVAFASPPDVHTAAHEAAHVVQQRGGVSLKGGVGRAGDAYEQHADAVADLVVRGESAADLLSSRASGGGDTTAIQRKTKGEEAYDKAHANWLDPNTSVKNDADVINAALKEIKADKSVEYNRKAGKKRIASALATLGKSKELSSAESDWDWLVDHRAPEDQKAKETYSSKQKALFDRLETPLAALDAKHPKAQTKYWLKNSPAQVLNVIIAVADAEIPADQVWAYANVEGLVDYVRGEIGLGAKADPTEAQLNSVSTTKAISGFDYLGVDDFFTDLGAKNEPLSGHLPKGYDTSKVTKDARTNEQGREVQSGIFPNLKMGLQALVASLKRRRAIFLADVKTHAYATPTTDELVYWTYVYFNSGEFNGQLKKYKGKRKLGDWISKGEYSNAIKLLDSYQMIKAMKIF